MRFEHIRSIPTRTGLRLQDKACIVTGAGSGIGKEIALTFAREGTRAAVADLYKGAAQSVADEILQRRWFGDRSRHGCHERGSGPERSVRCCRALWP